MICSSLLSKHNASGLQHREGLLPRRPLVRIPCWIRWSFPLSRSFHRGCRHSFLWRSSCPLQCQSCVLHGCRTLSRCFGLILHICHGTRLSSSGRGLYQPWCLHRACPLVVSLVFEVLRSTSLVWCSTRTCFDSTAGFPHRRPWDCSHSRSVCCRRSCTFLAGNCGISIGTYDS